MLVFQAFTIYEFYSEVTIIKTPLLIVVDHRHLGPRSRVKIIKDIGHAANIESPDAVNDLITSFVLGRSKWDIPSVSEKSSLSQVY